MGFLFTFFIVFSELVGEGGGVVEFVEEEEEGEEEILESGAEDSVFFESSV